MRNTEGRVKFDSLPGEVTGRVEGLNNLKSESCGCSRPALCDGPTSEVCCRIEWTGELDIYLQKNTVSSTLVTGIRKRKVVSWHKPQDSLAGDPLNIALRTVVSVRCLYKATHPCMIEKLAVNF